VRRIAPFAVAGAMVTLVLTGGCASDDEGVADDRRDQVRRAALDAGLTEEVADVLALAAGGASARFQITYQGTDGASVVVSQDPPNRRVDAVTAGLIVQSQVLRDGVAYRCDLPPDGQPGDPLECARTSGAVPGQGAFTPEALSTFTEELAASLATTDLTVETRTIAEVEATCLISAPKAGTTLDEAAPSVDTICLSDSGAQLLVDVGGERVVADSYSTEVPEGTFDV
jgi:hypothetical protein